MPIRPERAHLYPPDWKEISERKRKEAGEKCEWCGLANKAIGYRTRDGHFHEIGPDMYDGSQVNSVQIVLTVHHLDGNPANSYDDDNLVALCQKCHLTADMNIHVHNRGVTMDDRRGQGRFDFADRDGGRPERPSNQRPA